MTTQLGEALTALLDNRSGQIRAIDIGEVVDFSRGTGTATIRPVILRPGNAARSEIPRCAVIFPKVYWDLQAGERGLLLVCDHDYRRYWRQGEDSIALTEARHEIGNSVFLPGFTTQAEAAARSIPADSTVIEPGSAAGQVKLGGATASKAVLDGDAFKTAMQTWTGLVQIAIVAGGGGDITAANTALLAAITAALSSVVKIKV